MLCLLSPKEYHAFHAELGRHRGGGPGMVGLDRSPGDQEVTALGDRVLSQKLELPDLVAAGEQTGFIITLDRSKR